MSTKRDEALLDALVQSSFNVIAVVSEVAGRHNLSLTQLRVLAILRDHSPTMSELAEYLGLDRSTISGLIDRAAERGLVKRVIHDTDKRSSRASLTPAGIELAAVGAEEIAHQVELYTQRLSASDRESLTKLLEASMIRVDRRK